MKKLSMVLLLALVASVSFSQNKITYEQIKLLSKENKDSFPKSLYFDEYLASDGHVYKVGDTLKIGRPSTNKTFGFIYVGNGVLVSQTPADVFSSGTSTTLKKIFLNGTWKMGFRISFGTDGVCGICPKYYINVEEALATNELKSFGMNRENAIAKLKEQKELLDLGMISKEDFEKIKTELTPYIMASSAQK
jgi:hypothetical protein